MNDLETQIEKAYDYRGHCTVTLKDGGTVVGFVYNRVRADAYQPVSYIEMFPKDHSESVRFAFSELSKLECTGEDCAAGDSYHDYLEKKRQREKGEFDVK